MKNEGIQKKTKKSSKAGGNKNRGVKSQYKKYPRHKHGNSQTDATYQNQGPSGLKRQTNASSVETLAWIKLTFLPFQSSNGTWRLPTEGRPLRPWSAHELLANWMAIDARKMNMEQVPF